MPQHNRSRMGLHLRRLLALLFFAVSLTLASLRSGPIVYAMLFLSILLPILSAAYALYVYYRMRIVQLIANRFAVKNEPVDYTCRLANETASSFTAIRLVPLDDLSEITDFDSGRVFSLASGEIEEVNSTVVCRRRGVYPIGVEKILVTDILGIITFSFPPPVEFIATVYPRVLHLDSFGLFDLEGSRTRHMRSSSETEPADTVRDYERGDDPRMIHWKASARSGSLKVRQLGDIERPSLTVAVDTVKYTDGKAAISREDNLLEALLAMCDYCAVHSIPVDVYTQGRSFFIRSYKDFRELYDWSCHVVFSEKTPALTISASSCPCCALLTTGNASSAAAQLETMSAAGAECILMKFDGGDENISADSSKLRVISVPDECRIDRLLA